MPIQKQLSVFLENKPGVLARLCDSFADSKINILALTVSDTVDHAVVRLIVSHPEKALRLLEERGVLVVETEVLVLLLPHLPGALARIAERLSKAKVNIEYAYGTAAPGKPRSYFVLRVDDLAKARRALKA